MSAEPIVHSTQCKIHKADSLAGFKHSDCTCGALEMRRAKWYMDHPGIMSPREAQKRIDEYERQMEIDIEADNVSRLAAKKIMGDMKRRKVWWRRLGNWILWAVWCLKRL